MAKHKLVDVDRLQEGEVTFRYEAFGSFLRTLEGKDYDSHEVVKAYEAMITKYQYPVSVRLMLYYLGGFLYQFNAMYDLA